MTSKTIEKLRASTDPLENDLAEVLEGWQAARQAKGLSRSLGYEPRDINEFGVIEVISRRILSGGSGFEEVNPELSYESLALRHSDRFEAFVIAAAVERLKLGDSESRTLVSQDVQFLIKTGISEFFPNSSQNASASDWIGTDIQVPDFRREHSALESFLKNDFRTFLWLHEHPRDGAQGNGLVAVLGLAAVDKAGCSTVKEAAIFDYPIGEEIFKGRWKDEPIISNLNRSRSSFTQPLTESEVEFLFSCAMEKQIQIGERNEQINPELDLRELNYAETEDSIHSVVSRRYQAIFRKNLIESRGGHCAVVGTGELSVLEAAHIVPYRLKVANRNSIYNGLLLRADIHKLFDRFLISIEPTNREVVVSQKLTSADYHRLRGRIVKDDVSEKCLGYHYERFLEQERRHRMP